MDTVTITSNKTPPRPLKSNRIVNLAKIILAGILAGIGTFLN
jgi:hypothetical protein